jgi:hypothetical protein
MKQFFAKTRVILVALVLGGMMMISSQASAQTTSALISPPSPNKSWVSNPQAEQSVQAEINALTQQMNTLLQQQAPIAQIKEAKLLLQFYMIIQEGLNDGLHVSQALLNAKSSFLNEDSTIEASTKKKDKVTTWYNEALALFSI